MHHTDVTPELWDHLLALNAGEPRPDQRPWTPEEECSLGLYAPLAEGDQFTIGQIGQSLDGRIATVRGDARDISGPGGLSHLHRLRALVDAVIIGVKTALHDDPRLTVRLVKGNNPARVVIDPSGRLPDDAALLSDTSARRIVVQSVDRPRPPGVEVLRLPRDPWIAAQDILDALAGLGLHRVLIEGGGVTIAQFIEAQLLDRLHVAVAPLLIGAGPQSLTTTPVATLAEAIRPSTKAYDLGTDILFDCALTPEIHGR